jgi:hypothetical protein
MFIKDAKAWKSRHIKEMVESLPEHHSKYPQALLPTMPAACSQIASTLIMQ